MPRGPLLTAVAALCAVLAGGIADFFRANNIPFREDHEHWRRARDREREMRGEPPLSRRPEPVPVRFGAPPGGLPILTGANLPEDGKCTRCRDDWMAWAAGRGHGLTPLRARSGLRGIAASGLPSLGFFGPPPTGPAAPPAGASTASRGRERAHSSGLTGDARPHGGNMRRRPRDAAVRPADPVGAAAAGAPAAGVGTKPCVPCNARIWDAARG